jgi:hypothetical protein
VSNDLGKATLGAPGSRCFVLACLASAADPRDNLDQLKRVDRFQDVGLIASGQDAPPFGLASEPRQCNPGRTLRRTPGIGPKRTSRPLAAQGIEPFIATRRQKHG